MRIPPIISAVARMKVPSSLVKPPKNFKKADVKDFKKDMQTLGESIAEGYKRKVAQNIEENKYGYLNAPSTLAKKDGDTPLIDSHELVDSITREGTTVSVEDSPHSGSLLTNKQLAIIQEYGSKDLHVPARPVWRATFDEYKKEARKQIEVFLKTKKFKKWSS